MEMFIYLLLFDLEHKLSLWEEDLLGVIGGQVKFKLEVLVRCGQQVGKLVGVNYRCVSTTVVIGVHGSDQLPFVIIKGSVGPLIVNVDFDALKVYYITLF